MFTSIINLNQSYLNYRNRLASRSDSSSVRMSPSLTGPFTFLIICLFCSPMNSTFTWVHWPWDPVRPNTLITLARTTGLSILSAEKHLTPRADSLNTKKERTLTSKSWQKLSAVMPDEGVCIPRPWLSVEFPKIITYLLRNILSSVKLKHKNNKQINIVWLRWL